MVVDMRCRPPLPTWTKQFQFTRGDDYYEFVGFERPESTRTRTTESLLREMDAANVQWGVIMGRQAADPLGVIPNDEIAECVNAHPDRFVAWCGLDLARPIEWCVEEIRRCLELPGFKGVSIEPTISRNPSFHSPADKRLYPIYEECLRHEVPINITLSAQLQARTKLPYEDSTPVPLSQVARDFPKLVIHVAHCAWPWVMEMIGVAFTYPNIWLSPDQYMVRRLPGAELYVKAVQNYFEDRTVFGTAYPSRGHAQMVAEYESLGFSDRVLKKVLHDNALRLMKMK